MPIDVRRTRAWRKLRDQVIQEQPECQLAYAEICTGTSQTADHIKHVEDYPELAMDRENLRGSCFACNLHRGKRTDAQVAAAPARRVRALDIFKAL